MNEVAGHQDHLTRREIEILKLMAAGYTSYGEMAKKTFVSLGTIRTHVTHIYRKLNVNTRHDAVQRGKEMNLL
jgi:LuxR family maltose regulon positive regulatory protein